MAIEADLLRRFNGRPHDQPGPRALYGQADGSQDHRGKGKSPVPDLATRRDLAVDFGGGWSNGVTMLGRRESILSLGRLDEVADYRRGTLDRARGRYQTIRHT